MIRLFLGDARRVLLGVAAGAIGVIAAPVLDPGGTAFPYPAPAELRPLGENVVPDPSFEQTVAKRAPPGWFFGFHVYTPPLDAAQGAAIKARVEPTVEMRLAANRARTGSRSVFLHTPASAWRQGDLNFSARFEGVVALPQAFGAVAVQFAYRLQTASPAPGNGRVMVHFLDDKGAPVVPWQQFRLGPTPDWTLRTFPFALAAGVRRLGLTLYLDGCGIAEYDDLAVFPVSLAEPEPISVRCVPMHFLDGTFALSSGDPALIQFGVKGPTDPKPAPVEAHFLLALPEGVRAGSWHSALALAGTQPLTENGVTWRLHDFRVNSLGTFIGAAHDSVTGIVVLLQTELAPGAAVAPLRYWLEYAPATGQPRVKTAPVPLKLTVLPPVRGRAPQDFAVGAMLRKPSLLVGTGAAVQPYAEFIRRCGINWLPGASSVPAGQLAHALGLTVLSEGGIVNGYMFGWGTLPREWAFIRADGEPFPRGLCPTVIMRRLPYYVENVYDAVIHRQIAVDKTADGFTANWEPYMFFDKGCFCARCRQEFIAYSKLPAAEVERLWPLGVLKEHRQLWNRFSSWIHGRVIVTLDQDCRRAGRERGIDSCFIPEVTPVIFLPDKAEDHHTLHCQPAEYAAALSQYASWGGYWSFDYLNPDARRGVADRLDLLDSSTAFRAWIDRNCPAGQRPRLHWLFHSYQGGRGVTFPECLTFDLLCCFVVGMDGAWAYVFPKGYDNRYWHALALGADTVAEFEPYVRQGQRQSRHGLENVTPVPGRQSTSLLRSWEFAYHNHRLIAVANFWMDGDAFFRLRLQGLAADARHTLREPRAGRYYASPAGSAQWSAAELAAGALLHVGAMRWAFFLVEPNAGAPSGTAFAAADMAAAVAARQPGLAKAHAAAQRQIAASERAVSGDPADYSALKPVAEGDVKCVPRDTNDDGQPELVFSRPGDELVVELSKGARLLSWRLGGVDAAHVEGDLALGVDAFWVPAGFATTMAKVVELSATAAGLTLTTLTTMPESARDLAGLALRRELRFPRDPGQFRITTTVENTTATERTFSFRYANMPSCLTQPKTGEGWAVLAGADGPLRFTRNFLKNAYTLKEAPKTPALDAWNMDVNGQVVRPTVRLGCSWSPVVIEAEVPAAQFYKLVIWDSGAQACATVEWVFRQTTLKPGETWQTHIDWRRMP